MTLELVVGTCVVIAIVLLVRIAPDRVRFAVLIDGKFRALKGPGLMLKSPLPAAKWVRLSVGDRGTLISTGLADLNGVQIPVEVNSGDGATSRIRIVGFQKSLVIADKEPVS